MGGQGKPPVWDAGFSRETTTAGWEPTSPPCLPRASAGDAMARELALRSTLRARTTPAHAWQAAGAPQTGLKAAKLIIAFLSSKG